MREEEKPRGITTMRTITCENEAEAQALSESHPGSRVCELRRLFDGPSDWLLLVKK